MPEETSSSVSKDISNSKLYELLLEANKVQTQEIKFEINNSIQELSEKIDAVDTRVTTLENKILGLERGRRRNNIVIFGLEANDRDQNILENTLDIFKNTLGTSILKTDINNIYSYGKNAEGKKSHIVVEFISYLKKQEIFKNIANLKGTGIIITNDLCYEDRQVRRTLNDHRKKAVSQNLEAKIKGNKLEIDGKLFTLDDLSKLEQQVFEESSEAEEGEEEQATTSKQEEERTLPRGEGRKVKYNPRQGRNLRSKKK